MKPILAVVQRDEPNCFQQELLQVKGVGMKEPHHKQPNHQLAVVTTMSHRQELLQSVPKHVNQCSKFASSVPSKHEADLGRCSEG